MKQIFRKIYGLWAAVVFFLFLIIFFPFFLIPLLISQKLGFITCYFLKLWASIFGQLTRIRYRIHGRENVSKNASYIYTCNHTSYLDTPGVAIAIPGQWRPLGKKELLKVPVFGLVLKYLAIIVDRSNPKSRQESIHKMSAYLKKGISIMIYPEGTMNRTDKVLQPFYDGAFRMAIETQNDIVPMVSINAGNLMHPSKMEIRPGTIDMVIGKPISANGMTLKEIPVLKEKVYNAMKELIEKGEAGRFH